MKSRLLVLSSLAWVFAAGFALTVAEEQELSDRELRRLVKQADNAYEKGRVGQAVELYERVFDATAPGDDRRSTGLFVVAWNRLAAGTAESEAVARRYLDEVAELFPDHPQRTEVLAVRSLLARLDASQAALESVRTELATREAALEAALKETAEVAGLSGEARDQIQSQLRSARAELAETRSELAKKEEALQRLLKLCAGGG